jgi:hypothetical protein
VASVALRSGNQDAGEEGDAREAGANDAANLAGLGQPTPFGVHPTCIHEGEVIVCHDPGREAGKNAPAATRDDPEQQDGRAAMGLHWSKCDTNWGDHSRADNERERGVARFLISKRSVPKLAMRTRPANIRAWSACVG